MIGSFRDKEQEDIFKQPPEYIWVRDEDGAVKKHHESFADMLKRWLGAK